MSTNYKNIVITPNRSTAANVVPSIQFSGGDATTNTDINLKVYTTSNGTLSFDGSAGQLFSITNDLSGVIFSVNDVSGIPSIEVDANGRVSLAQFSGNVGIGTASPTFKLDVSGDMRVTGNVILGDASTDTITLNGSFISLGNNQNIDSGTLFIDAVNNEVGIGITNPTSNLHVIGTANISGSLIVLGSNVTQAFISGNAYATAVGTSGNAYALATATAVGTAGNTFASSVGVGANAYAATVGTSANVYAASVGVGANTYATSVGTSGNAFAITIGTSSNSYATAVGTSGNAYALATATSIGTAGNTFASSVGVGANSYAATVGTSANVYAASVGVGANTYATAVGTSGNAYALSIATSIGTAGNTYAASVGVGANSYATSVGTSGNTFAASVGIGANAYATSIGASSNAWANTIGTSSNSYATAVGAAGNTYTLAAFNRANTALQNTSGTVFSGTLPITGNVLIGRTDSTVGQNVLLDVAGAVNASAVLVNGTPLTSGGASVYSANVGNNSANTFTINHALNKTYVIPAVRENATGYYAYPDIRFVDANNIVLEFIDPPTTNAYVVIVLG